uniref:Uncharacterized protein n=1 Tax=Salix viminalis TaxID=40686 RepID=A0A6N2LBL9_SALVM
MHGNTLLVQTETRTSRESDKEIDLNALPWHKPQTIAARRRCHCANQHSSRLQLAEKLSP